MLWFSIATSQRSNWNDCYYVVFAIPIHCYVSDEEDVVLVIVLASSVANTTGDNWKGRIRTLRCYFLVSQSLLRVKVVSMELIYGIQLLSFPLFEMLTESPNIYFLEIVVEDRENLLN